MNDDVTALPDDIRALVEEADNAQVVDEALRARAWAGLEKSLGVSAGSAVLGASATSIKGIVLVVGALFALGLGVDVALRAFDPPTAAPVVTETAPIVMSPAPVVVMAPAVMAPAPIIAPVVSAPSPVPTTPAVVTAPPAATAARDAERRLIEGARAALARGDLDDARVALDAHAQAHAKGELEEDREALVVLLAFRRGDVTATTREASFRARYPTSVYGAVLERARLKSQADLKKAKDLERDSQSPR